MDARSEKIIDIFKVSWEETVKHYDNLLNFPGWDRYIPVRQFVEDMIETGEDRFFHAGTSMATLMISRSVNHGLRKDQKFVSIEAIGDNDYEIKLREYLKTYREYRITNLDDPRLNQLLKTLKDTLVD